MNMSIGKFIGCVMMVIGSAIGAGILGLPPVTAGPGFIFSALGAVGGWVLLTITGLLMLEVTLALPEDACSFGSMAHKTLGWFGRIITALSVMFLLYFTLISYIAGEASLISVICEEFFHITVPLWIIGMLFTVILGSVVFWSTEMVDDINRGLFSVKGFLLLATIVLMLPYVNIQHLIYTHNLEHSKYLLGASPILFCVLFNFHFIIPSLRKYVGNKPTELKWIIIVGTTISLIIYLLWMVGTLGAVPLDGEIGFKSLSNLGHDAGPGDVAKLIVAAVNNKWVSASIHGFCNIAMTTSFLGVSLGLFDFLAEGCKRPNTRFGRFQTSILTFVPPFLITIFLPHIFQKALTATGSATAILAIILPALMVYKMRKNNALQSSYRAFGNNALFVFLVIIGLVFVVLPVLTNMGMLPSFI